MKPVLYAIVPSHLNLYSLLLIINVVYVLPFVSLFIITPFPSFFFKKYCLLVLLLVCLVDSCPLDFKHPCFFVF